MSLTQSIKNAIGRGPSRREKADAGEYCHQFCPHCGEWVPSHYSVTSGILPEEDLGDMKVRCPSCERTTVMELIATQKEDLAEDE